MSVNSPVNVQEFILILDQYSDDLIVKIGNNSYIHNMQSVKNWFIRIGVSSLMINKILDAVYNFHKIKYIIQEQRLLSNV